MKNALFSGISYNKKQDDSSDDEPKKQEQEPVAAQVNLLDMDEPSQPSQPSQPAAGGNLLDLMSEPA